MIAFFYGSLKQGFAAHSLLGDAKFIGEATTHSRYHLFHQGHYPGMVEDAQLQGVGVRGELYEIDDSLLEVLDRYEGVAFGLFVRAEIELNDGRMVSAYLVRERSNTLIESGIWNDL